MDYTDYNEAEMHFKNLRTHSHSYKRILLSGKLKTVYLNNIGRVYFSHFHGSRKKLRNIECKITCHEKNSNHTP